MKFNKKLKLQKIQKTMFILVAIFVAFFLFLLTKPELTYRLRKSAKAFIDTFNDNDQSRIISELENKIVALKSLNSNQILDGNNDLSVISSNFCKERDYKCNKYEIVSSDDFEFPTKFLLRNANGSIISRGSTVFIGKYLVGFVEDIGDNFITVRTILDKNTELSVATFGKENVGLAKYDKNFNLAITPLTHSKELCNDCTVLTFGPQNKIFINDLIVGKTYKNGDNFYIKFDLDIKYLDYLYIVEYTKL